jgi:hypothetical protein
MHFKKAKTQDRNAFHEDFKIKAIDEKEKK